MEQDKHARRLAALTPCVIEKLDVAAGNVAEAKKLAQQEKEAKKEQAKKEKEVEKEAKKAADKAEKEEKKEAKKAADKAEKEAEKRRKKKERGDEEWAETQQRVEKTRKLFPSSAASYQATLSASTRSSDDSEMSKAEVRKLYPERWLKDALDDHTDEDGIFKITKKLFQEL